MKRRTTMGPIGLDLGASSIKLIQLRDHDGQPAVAAAAYLDLPRESADSAGYDATVADCLAGELRRHEFQGRDVVTALGLDEFQMKSIRLPKMPEEELEGAIQFESQDRFDLGGKTAQFRHLPAGEVRHGNEIKNEVIVFAAPDDIVQSRLQLLRSLKLNPLAIDLTPCAMARSFVRFLRRSEDAQAVNVFIDIGWRGTCIVITHGAEMTFLKVLNIGGQHLTESVSKALSLSMEDARALRVRLLHDAAGRRASDRSNVSDEVRSAVADAVRPLIEKLQRDVQLCLRYYAVTFRGQRPESLTLVGGEAHEATLMHILAEGLDVPCLIGHPARGMNDAHKLTEHGHRCQQPAWAAACGLALRGSPWVQPSGPASKTERRRTPVGAVS